jgi:hypothetical protein
MELLIVGDAGAPGPVDAEVMRRHARDAFGGIPYGDWDGAYEVARQLLQLVGPNRLRRGPRRSGPLPVSRAGAGERPQARRGDRDAILAVDGGGKRAAHKPNKR